MNIALWRCDDLLNKAWLLHYKGSSAKPRLTFLIEPAGIPGAFPTLFILKEISTDEDLFVRKYFKVTQLYDIAFVENAPRIQHVSIRKVSRGLADHVLISVRPDCV
jgi:hypothetical protein